MYSISDIYGVKTVYDHCPRPIGMSVNETLNHPKRLSKFRNQTEEG